MSLATRCPACTTVFRVVQDQLRVSEGWVRCGQCQEVFNALEGLFELAAPEAPSGVVARGATESATPPARQPSQVATTPSPPATASTPLPTPSAHEPAPPWPGAVPSRTGTASRAASEMRSPLPTDPVGPRGANADPAEPPADASDIPDRPEMPDLRDLRDLRDLGGAPRQPSAGDDLTRAHQRPGSGGPAPSRTSTAPPSPFTFAEASDSPPPWAGATPTAFESGLTTPEEAARLPDDNAQAVDAVDVVDGGSASDAADPWEAVASSDAAEAHAPATSAIPQPVDPPEPPAPAYSGDPFDPFEPAADFGVDGAAAQDSAFGADDTPDALAATDDEDAPTPSRFIGPVPDWARSPAGPRARKRRARTPPGANAEGAHAHAIVSDKPHRRRRKPEFVRQAERAAFWRRPLVRAMLGSAALALGLMLTGQVVYQHRDSIAAQAPALAPALQAGCDALQCRIDAPRVLDRIRLDASDLNRTDQDEVLRLTAELHNTADHAVRMPALDVSFTDASGQVVSRKVLQPTELGARSDALPADGRWRIDARLAVGDLRIAGYTVEVFYP